MTESIEIREKTTSPINMYLQSDGSPINLSGVAFVKMNMIDSEGKTYHYTSVDTASSLAIVTATSGYVRFTPYSGDVTIFRYQNNPYKIYFDIFETSSQHYSVPESGDEAEIKVRKEF